MKLTPEKLTAFCAALAETGQVSKACKAVGISRMTAYEWRQDIPEFREAWAKALKVAQLVLEDEAMRRAVEGVDEPLVHKGQFTYRRDYAAIDPETGERVHPLAAPVLLGEDGSPIPETVKKYSDTMLIFTLKAADPAKYRDNSHVTLAGDADNPLSINDGTAATRLATLLAAAEARKRAQGDDDDLSDLI